MMIIEKIPDDTVPVKQSETAGLKNVEPVQVVSPLPESGKELPPSGYNLPPSKDSIEEAVKEINKFVESTQSELQFSLDEDSGKTVIKVLDSSTRELIRQIPSEEALRLARQLREGGDLEIFKGKT
ncbi:MAG TPA: flagellar protein FlaG [Gammaproteobacteria bacterium]|nr:flagellar protein FlaG [Gammaproteobacteria bacterium]